MNKELIGKIATYTLIVLFFAVLAYGFTPQVLGRSEERRVGKECRL